MSMSYAKPSQNLLQKVLSEYETPLYLYDEEVLEQRVNELKDNLPEGSRIYHSLKSNPLPALIQASVNCGCIPEVCSENELEVACNTGVDKALILFSGPAKTPLELQTALSSGVRRFSAESWVDLQRVNEALEQANNIAVSEGKPKISIDILLRVNPETSIDAGLSMSGAATQFGFEESDIANNQSRLNELSDEANIAGFHIYFGTQMSSIDAIISSFKEGILCAERLSEALSITPSIVDLGGGFPWPYANCELPGKDAKSFDISQIRGRFNTEIEPLRHHTRQAALWFESGRYITASSGTLITEVLDVKLSKDNTRFVVLDTGINHLGGMAGLGRVPRGYVTLQAQNTPELDSEPAFEGKTSIVGPLCSPLDRLSPNADLPKVKVGDILAIPNTGAYGLTASLVAFLTRPTPLEITFKKDTILSIHQLKQGHEKKL